MTILKNVTYIYLPVIWVHLLRYKYTSCGQALTIAFSPKSSMAAQSVRSKYCKSSRRGGSLLMLVIREQPGNKNKKLRFTFNNDSNIYIINIKFKKQ